MGPRDWARIARLIEEQYFDYDGFVVIMGTDTVRCRGEATAN